MFFLEMLIWIGNDVGEVVGGLEIFRGNFYVWEKGKFEGGFEGGVLDVF